MPLVAGCPRCPAPVSRSSGEWRCADHGAVPPFWRPEHPSYDELGEHLALADGFPTYLPWPLSPGWLVSDFGVVGTAGRVRATTTSVTGPSPEDGAVELLVVVEEAGTGLGARCARTVHSDPGEEIAWASPTTRIRLGSQAIRMWPVSTAGSTGDALDRSVLAGEAGGRWLWLVLRPASAVLMLTDEWILADVSGFGAQLLETPFGGSRPTW